MADGSSNSNRPGGNHPAATDPGRLELREWIESLDELIEREGHDRAARIIQTLQHHAAYRGVRVPFTANTPYINTIALADQPPYPGNREIERRIKSFVRWNAMAMVVRANKANSGIGGHISTYASCATLWEVAFNHFLRAHGDGQTGDLVYFQGHASPGVYARAYLEGRLTEKHLENFRRDLHPEAGLSSYPHPWLMPDFWEFPTVSMGLSPIMAIYQARFNRYLADRGLADATGSKVWCFMGDGETDEPESLGAINIAAREQLDNLVFVINCNLQRLDGPVRGNSKVIQELERTFRGAGWNVIKVIWGEDWDPLFERDESGALARRVEDLVDGEEQKYSVESGAYIREHMFGTSPELKKMVEHLSDEKLTRLRRGGHDPEKVHAAYRAAMDNTGAPTVILAKTIKGYGLGEAGEGRNVTHQQKKLNEDELREFRTRFGIPISDEDVAKAPFYKPPEDSPEMKYLRQRREALGGPLPSRRVRARPLDPPDPAIFEEFNEGSEGREVATTMAYVRMLAKLLRDKNVGRLIVPIIPDEARTFGMESLFRQCGIYSHVGQLYEPVDAKSLLYYKEATDGQILEEGITEAGSMSSFIAAGSAHATFGVNTIPFFTYYSMFGFQRIGDLIWAAGDMRCRGFLVGGTAGRTTLNGEGLQHEDGHSHLLALPVPNLMTYDPAFAYEIAVIIEEGIRRMFVEQEDIFYYFTVYNEFYEQPPMPGGKGVREGILNGLYKFRPSPVRKKAAPRLNLLGSGTILNHVLEAQRILAEDYGIAADVWSATSYKLLSRDAQEVVRWNMRHPGRKPRVPYVTKCLGREPVATVAASDYLKALPDLVARHAAGPFRSLGTDGYGRSDTREALRRFFEVDAPHIVVAALDALAEQDKVETKTIKDALKKFRIDPDSENPLYR